VDAGHEWLIFALPPAEVAVHPSEEDDRHELYFMCDDLSPGAKIKLQCKADIFSMAAGKKGFAQKSCVRLGRTDSMEYAEISNTLIPERSL
jgi:hypothetical protein